MKLLWDEGGSATVEEAFATDTITSSTFTYVELRSAIAGATRSGRFGPEIISGLGPRLRTIWREVAHLPLTQATLHRAADLTDSVGLRAGDAVQLASLLFAGGPDLVRFACFDLDLRRAAGELGYEFVPPESEMRAF